MILNTNGKDDLVTKIVDSAVSHWNNVINESNGFWRTFMQSYYSEEIKSFKAKQFISSISFYPFLIQRLVSAIKNINIDLEITFFSTLLPRHYWNFPTIIPKFKHNEKGKYYISKNPEFLNSYRETINGIIKNKRKNIKLKRVLFLSSEKPENELFFRNTRLFSLTDLRDDNKYYVNFADPSRNLIKLNEYNFRKINSYSIGINPIATLYTFFEQSRNYRNNPELEYYLRTMIETGDTFYNFEKTKTEHNISLLKYYIDHLHSDGGAKIILIGKNDSQNKVFETMIPRYSKESLNLKSDFKPDMAKIKILNHKEETEYTIYLNTYMDILNDIVKMEVISEDSLKYELLEKDVNSLLGKSYSLRSKFTNIKRHKNISIDKKVAREVDPG